MKVCILSMQRIDNMGSLLQSYALKKTIEKLGNEVEFIDIAKRDEDYELLGNYKQEYREERENDSLIGKFSKVDRYILNRLKIKRKSTEQSVVFEEFRKGYLDIEMKSLKYDTCVIGSDEVFNCLGSGAWGFTSQLFGNVPEAKKVITYAASCGSTTYEKLPNAVVCRIKETFKKVEGFSVRDKNTREFVEKLIDRVINENLDPVLIYDFDKEVKHAVLPQLPEHYCVVYSYYNRIHSSEEIKSIKEFCKKNGLTPVSIGAPQFWIKDYVICSPFQCLKVFQNADFVITDTFHGTIFSAKYADKFAIVTRESNYNKLSDLINRLGLENHWVGDMSRLESAYRIEKSIEIINRNIERGRIQTYNYLEKCINGK